jgi:flagellar biosynthetic protein FliR
MLDLSHPGSSMPALLPASWTPWATRVFLLSLRVGVVLALTPVLRLVPMPAPARVLMILALAVSLAGVGAGSGTGGVQHAPHDDGHARLPDDSAGILAGGFTGELPKSPAGGLHGDVSGSVSGDLSGGLLGAALAEMALGATLALGVMLAFAAFSVAGNLLDIQVGFGIAQVFDPSSNRQLPILTSLFNQLALLLFFLADGHHFLLRGLAASTVVFPPGAWWSPASGLGVIVGQAGAMFSLGFALAAPVVFCLLLVELALGVIARNLPQMNMFAVGIPVKLVAGLAALAFWLPGMGPAGARVHNTIHQGWHDWFETRAADDTSQSSQSSQSSQWSQWSQATPLAPPAHPAAPSPAAQQAGPRGDR